MKVYKPFYRFASLNDDNSTIDITGDYSSTPGRFKIVADNDTDLIIHRVIITIRDGTINSGDVYGGLGAALTNGIIVRINDSSDTTLVTLTSQPIKNNGHWAGASYDYDVVAGFSTGDDYAHVRWTFSKAGWPIVLKAGSGNYIEVYANDNFTGLVEHRYLFQGYNEYAF